MAEGNRGASIIDFAHPQTDLLLVFFLPIQGREAQFSLGRTPIRYLNVFVLEVGGGVFDRGRSILLNKRFQNMAGLDGVVWFFWLHQFVEGIHYMVPLLFFLSFFFLCGVFHLMRELNVAKGSRLCLHQLMSSGRLCSHFGFVLLFWQQLFVLLADDPVLFRGQFSHLLLLVGLNEAFSL